MTEEIYDGCSDFLFEAGAELLRVYPANDEAMQEVKNYIKEYCLTSDDVQILKNKESIRIVTKIDVTLTMLHKGDISHEYE